MSDWFDFENAEDLGGLPDIDQLLASLATYEDLELRRSRVHLIARLLAGQPWETVCRYRDRLVDAGYIRSSDFMRSYREADAERDQQQQAAREAAGEEDDKGPSLSQATVLAQMALDNYVLGITSSEDTYAVSREGPQIPKMVRGPGLSLRPELEARYHDERDAVPNAQALIDAVRLLDSKAHREEPVDLHLRTARHDSNVIIDMGDDSGRVVEIIPNNWQILDATPGPLFQRTRATKVLPEPARDGTLDDLRAAVNVTAESEPLIAAALVQALMPDASHPIMLLRGQQGAGKSTRTRRIVDLLDPNTVPLRKPPKDADGWVVAAGASWTIALDNISTIPEWLSDSLCRAVTGEGDIRRALYTDNDMVASRSQCIRRPEIVADG